MKLWLRYFFLQGKRMTKALPRICLYTVLLTVGLLIILGAMLLFDKNSDDKKPVSIGMVGNMEESYLGVGIRMLKNLPSIKRLVDIDELTKEEAQKCFAKGEISGYLLIPDGFVDSIVTGENLPLTYVTAKEGENIGTLLMEELVSILSDMITTTQTSVQALRVYLLENGNTDSLWENMQEYNASLLEQILDRDALFLVKEIGISNKISLSGQLFTGFLLFLLLLWGLYGAGLLVRREDSTQLLLKAKGLNGIKQVLCEELAYAGLLFVSLCVVLFCAFVLKATFGLSFREWDGMGFAGKASCFLRLLLILFLFSCMQGFFCELVHNMIAGGLLQFVVAVVLGYGGGCLYPLSFFPEAMQKVGAWSPSGVCLRFLQAGFTGQKSAFLFVIMLLYTVAFLFFWMTKREGRL